MTPVARYEQLLGYLQAPAPTYLGDYVEWLHPHDSSEPPFDWGDVEWLHAFPRDTQLMIATLAVATNLGTVVELEDVTREINGRTWVWGEIQMTARTVLEYLSEPESSRSQHRSALRALAESCDEFIPDPEMTLDGKLFAVTAAACIAFAAADCGPGDRDVDPWMALMHVFRPVYEDELDFRDIKLRRWSNRVRSLLAVVDPRADIEFADATALVPLTARPQAAHAS